MINSHRNPHGIGTLLQGVAGETHGMDLTFWKIARMLREQGLRIVAVRPIGFWVMRARLRTDKALNGRGGKDRRAHIPASALGAVRARLRPDCPEAVIGAGRSASYSVVPSLRYPRRAPKRRARGRHFRSQRMANKE